MGEGRDRAVLDAELNVNYASTEQALDEGKLVDATLAVDEKQAA